MSSLFLTIILGATLTFSLLTNLFLMWYIYRAIQQLTYQETDLSQVVEAVKNFNTHLQSVYEMELFYGDETLRYLLQHSSDLVDMLQEYIFFVENNGEGLDDDPEEA